MSLVCSSTHVCEGKKKENKMQKCRKIVNVPWTPENGSIAKDPSVANVLTHGVMSEWVSD